MIDALVVKFMECTNLCAPTASRLWCPQLHPYDFAPRRKRVTKRKPRAPVRTRVFSNIDQNLLVEDDSIRLTVEEPAVEFGTITVEDLQQALRTLDAINNGEVVPVPNLPAITDDSDLGISNLNLNNVETSTAPCLFPEAYEDSNLANNISAQQSQFDLRTEVVDDLAIPNLVSNDVEMPMVAPDMNLDNSLFPPPTPEVNLDSILADTTMAQQETTEGEKMLLQTKQRNKSNGRKKNIFRRSTMISGNRLDTLEAEALKDREILYRPPSINILTFDFISVDFFNRSFITEENYRALHGPLLTNDAVNLNPIFKPQNCDDLVSNALVNTNAIVDANIPPNDAILPSNDANIPPNNAILPVNNEIPELFPMYEAAPPQSNAADTILPSQTQNMGELNATDSDKTAQNSNSTMNSSKNKPLFIDVVRQKSSSKTPSFRVSRSMNIDFDSTSIKELVEMIRLSRRQRSNSIRRMSTPSRINSNSSMDPGMFLSGVTYEYESDIENNKLLEEIDGALCTTEKITFDELRPVEFTDRLSAAYTFKVLLRLWAGKKVSIQQTGPAPQNIFISK